MSVNLFLDDVRFPGISEYRSDFMEMLSNKYPDLLVVLTSMSTDTEIEKQFPGAGYDIDQFYTFCSQKYPEFNKYLKQASAELDLLRHNTLFGVNVSMN